MNFRNVIVSVNGIPCVPAELDDDPPAAPDDLAPPWEPRLWPRASAACLQLQIDGVGLVEQHLTDAGLARLPEPKRGDVVEISAARVKLQALVVALVRRHLVLP